MTATIPRLPDVILQAQTTASTSASESSGGSYQETIAADGALIPVIYGRQRVGPLIFALAVGSDDYLTLGCLWGAGPIEAIEAIHLNDRVLTGGGYIRTDYLGSVVQGVDTKLAGLISGYADTLVMSVGGAQLPLAYSVISVHASICDGFPRLNATIQGRKVYDPRTGTTAYSRNPALCLADWLSNSVYGQGLSLDWTSVGDVADDCDDTLSDSSARRELDLVIDRDLPVAQWSDILRTYAGCFIAHSGSTVKLVSDRPATATRSLTASDFLEGTFTLRRAATRDRPSVVECHYTDNTVTPWRTAAVQAKATGVDAGTVVRRVDTLTLPGVTRRAQAYREAVERLNAATLTDLEASWLTFDAGLQDLIGDVVNVTHPVGLTTQPMRITDAQLAAPGRWQVSALSYDADVYSDSITPPTGGDYTDLPDPTDIPDVSGLAAASGNSYLLKGTDGSIVSRMAISWTAPSFAYLLHVEVQTKRSTDTDWSVVGLVVGATAVIAAPVEDGVTYDIRARIVNSLGQLGDWTDTQHVVVGKTEVPPDVDSFSVAALADGTRSLTWSLGSPPADLAGYQIRYVTGTSTTWSSMAALHTGTLSSSPYETNLLAAGTWSFGIKAVDTSGNESTNALFITTTLPDPRLSGVLEYLDCYDDGWSGTKTNGWVGPDGILYATDANDWADLSGSTWSAWTSWAQDANDLSYEIAVIDLGVVTTFTPLVSAICPEGTLTLQEKTSDDNVTWTAYTACGSAPLTARYYRAKASVSGSAGDILRLEGMTVVLDADPLEEEIEDLATSSLSGSYDLGVGNVRLPITKAFSSIRTVFITLQSVGAGWSWELIDKDTSVGPQIKIYNSSNTLADATIDALIRGL